MTDRYRWAGIRPHDRSDDSDPIEPGDVFEPTDAELEAFRDLLEPVDEDEELPDGESGTLPFNPESKTIPEIEEKLEDVDDEETLEALRNLEQQQKDRDGAVDAIEARLEEV